MFRMFRKSVPAPPSEPSTECSAIAELTQQQEETLLLFADLYIGKAKEFGISAADASEGLRLKVARDARLAPVQEAGGPSEAAPEEEPEEEPAIVFTKYAPATLRGKKREPLALYVSQAVKLNNAELERLATMDWGAIQRWIAEEHPHDLESTMARIFPADHNALDLEDTRHRMRTRLRLSVNDLLAKKNGKAVYTMDKMIDYLRMVRPELVK
jgi:hypothetical protein